MPIGWAETMQSQSYPGLPAQFTLLKSLDRTGVATEPAAPFFIALARKG